MPYRYRYGFEDSESARVDKYNELTRLMFNLESRRDRIMDRMHNADLQSVKLRNNMQAKIEKDDFLSANSEAILLVENNYDKVSLQIVLKKINFLLSCLKKFSNNLDLFDEDMMKMLNKVDKAIRVKNLKHMDKALTKLNSYLDPQSGVQELSYRAAILPTNKDEEVKRLMDEVTDEVYMIQRLAGESIERNFIKYQETKYES